LQETVVWRYETDEEPKRKHHWKNEWAGTVVVHGVVISKCPSGLTRSEAEDMLNTGIPWSSPKWRNPYPQRIYAVREGVVYRATPTNPGVSYHGFPELIDSLPPDRELRNELLARAKIEGREVEVAAWLQS
jgi:hypothetical protein